jgi:hypothetical protein
VLFRAFLDKISNAWFCLFIISIVIIVVSTIIIYIFFFFDMSIQEGGGYSYLRFMNVSCVDCKGCAHNFFNFFNFFQWLVWSGTIILIMDLRLLFLI